MKLEGAAAEHAAVVEHMQHEHEASLHRLHTSHASALQEVWT
jgi:hypothetical protein